MSALHHVGLDAAPVRHWRNGGGLTQELLTWPPHMPHWRLRVSLATVAAAGPFSVCPGVLRWLAVVEGDGLVLDVPGGARTVAAGDPALAFDGEAAPEARPIGGPSHVLNLMVRRDVGTARLWRDPGVARLWRAVAGDRVTGPTRWRAVYAAGDGELEIDGARESVPARTLAWTDARAAAPWRLHTADPRGAWFMTLEV